jgi:two-component system nitrate/nitrite response regulator NarL
MLMLTVSEDEQRPGRCAARRRLRLPAQDDGPGDALTGAIQRAMRGESVVSPEMTGKLVSAFRRRQGEPAPQHPKRRGVHRLAQPVTARARDPARGIARGASNKEIARELGIAETTVKIHVQHILRKLDVQSRVQAAVIATASHGGLIWRQSALAGALQ